MTKLVYPNIYIIALFLMTSISCCAQDVETNSNRKFFNSDIIKRILVKEQLENNNLDNNIKSSSDGSVIQTLDLPLLGLVTYLIKKIMHRLLFL